MNRIRQVEINRLWGIKNIKCSLNEDVNIIIGSNGSGKTTFLNIIEAVLQCDIPVLCSIQFDSVVILLEENNSIRVIQTIEEDSVNFKYIFNDTDEYTFSSNDSGRRTRTSIYFQNTLSTIHQRLEDIVKVAWLSVNRYNPINRRDDYRESIEDNFVNIKLRRLMHDLLVYRLRLEGIVNDLSNQQNQEVFSLLLYNSQYDKYNPQYIQEYQNFDTKSIQTALFRVFHQLGISSEKRNDIKGHINAMSATVHKIINHENLTLNDIFPLSLVNRTLSLIEISKKYTSLKDNVLEPVTKYLGCLQRFMNEKIFTFSEKTGNLNIQLKPVVSVKEGETSTHNIEIQHYSLSSGEKQLLILLTQTLLQEKQPYIYIADEPELSLHIEWQHKILGAIKELNPKVQIIVATHSPEIAGQWKSNITNLENVTEYGS